MNGSIRRRGLYQQGGFAPLRPPRVLRPLRHPEDPVENGFSLERGLRPSGPFGAIHPLRHRGTPNAGTVLGSQPATQRHPGALEDTEPWSMVGNQLACQLMSTLCV